MSSHPLTIGNYRLVQELASGAFGRVYRAEHLYLSQRVVAIKLLHSHLATEKERQGFLQEAQLLEMLKHPHILPIVDVGIHEGTPYMITEFAAGGSLRQRLRQQAPNLLPWAEALRILEQIAQALDLAHQRQIVHRDLKPENILFHQNGNALLADFGISTVLSSMSMQMATISGTPPYMAPEQFKGTVSKETDQYALGCIAYELMTGRQPFTAPDFWALGMMHLTEAPPSPRQFNAALPESISQAILKTLAKERRERFGGVLDFIQAVKGASESTAALVPTIYAPPAPPSAPLPQTDRSGPGKQGTNNAGQAKSSNARDYYNKGVELYKLKRFEEALAVYEQAIRLDPQGPNAYNGKGAVLHDLKRWEEALTAYEEAIRLNPQYAMAYNNKGLTLRDLKRFEEALAAYEQAIRLNPQSALAYRNKGATLDDLKRFEEALAAYEQAIRLDPTNGRGYHGRGKALDQLDRHEEAQQAFEQARKLGYTE